MKTETKPTHTPTPWKVEDKTTLADSAGHVIAITASREQSDLANEANAAFIVRAVNVHEELMRVCVYALNELEHPHANPENKTLTIQDLKQALAKAEGL
jgi:hypothetical protein